MRLLVLRHAEAEPAFTTDAGRALTPLGLEQAARVGAYCQRYDLRPELVLTSPYRRAVQTGEIVAAALGGVSAKVDPLLASGMQPADGMEGLREYGHLACVLIVGHQPDLGLLTASLLGLQEAEHVPFKLASLAGLRVDRFAFFGASLEFFIPLSLM